MRITTRKIIYPLIAIAMVFIITSIDTTTTPQTEDRTSPQIESTPVNNAPIEEKKYGLTEDERRSFFRERLAAEHRANAEAEEQYPLDSLDPRWRKDDAMKNIDLSTELFEKYRAELRTKYGIDEGAENAIKSEGITKQW